MKLHFYLRFHTHFGQSLWISGNLDELGNRNSAQALPMQYLDPGGWVASINIKRKEIQKGFSYNYFLKDEQGEILREWGNDRQIGAFKKDREEIYLVDTWNHAGEYENVFLTAPFRGILLRSLPQKKKISYDKNYTHIFRVKAPLLKENEVVCLLGASKALGDWETDKPILLGREKIRSGQPGQQSGWWTAKLDLSGARFPLAYKYGVYDSVKKTFIRYEEGNNRSFCSDSCKKTLTILHDGFVHLPNSTWKGAGVAIPVFSLRTRNSFGTGEFSDIKKLADWAEECGLKLLQFLPVNDTMAAFNRADSYPYSALSAFALHPLYINLREVAGKEYADQLDSLQQKQEQLNALAAMDYEEVMKIKWAVLKELYEVMGADSLASDRFKLFFKNSRQWLEGYAAFCFYRDQYGTADFRKWKTDNAYNKEEITRLCSEESPHYRDIGFYYFIQYYLHLQLAEAVDYVHKKGMVVKGDLPIGISPNSCDAWMASGLFNEEWKTGAPPDDFTAIGQNWGFPTYNWKEMERDRFDWWKQRLGRMNLYFDAYRIDHILGFFRTWSIPAHAVQGIMGRFIPCLPVSIHEFSEGGIWLDYQRYCRPFITDEILDEIFPGRQNEVKEAFLIPNEFGGYDLRQGLETQKQIELFFEGEEQSEENEKRKLGLFDLVSNVILFEEEGSYGQAFHFRIAMEKTLSFKHLIPHVQEKMISLYIDYFYHRQNGLWYREAMRKLPPLKEATEMLVCGEDLGMVPDAVPELMKQLGILSLEIQRMPKNRNREFFHPRDAPYLSVVSPSTHDMSTVRGWWEEDRERTRRFYNQELGQWGEAPVYCEPWICRVIVLQHLHSPALWSIFLLQDLLGTSETLRREKPQEERINIPADPHHYWQYRMHISLEELIDQKEFNEELKGYITHCGR